MNYLQEISEIKSRLFLLRQQLEVEYNTGAELSAMLSAIDVALQSTLSIVDSYTVLVLSDKDKRE
jgi:hypothetical protein